MVRDRLVVVVVAGRLGISRPVPDDLIIPVAAEAGIRSGVPLADVRRRVSVLAENAQRCLKTT